MATLYEKLSANEDALLAARLAFARKANWHRILARMAGETELPAAEENLREEPGAQLQSEVLLFSPSRLWSARDKAELAAEEF